MNSNRIQGIKILNFIFGFSLIFLSSSAGFFLAKDSSYALLENKEFLTSWLYSLQKSSHAHANLFGFIHIAYALSLTSSLSSLRLKIFETAGIFAGSLAMSLLLFIRAYFPLVKGHFDYLGNFMGFLLSCYLLALSTHLFGLIRKFLRVL